MWQLGSPNNPKRKLLLGISLLGTTSNVGASFNAGITVTQSMSGRSVKESNLVSDTLVSLASGGHKTVYASGSSAVNVVNGGSGHKTSVIGFGSVVVISEQAVGNKQGNGSLSNLAQVFPYFDAASAVVNSFNNSTVVSAQFAGMKAIPSTLVNAVQIGLNIAGSKVSQSAFIHQVTIAPAVIGARTSSNTFTDAMTVVGSYSGYKVSRASVNKVVIVNAYGEGKAYFKVTLACLHSRYYIVTALVPKYLVHTALFPVTISATILTTKCATLAVTHSSNIGKQITLTSRILACQKECY